MTSNIGSQYLLEGIDANGNISQEAKDQVSNELKMSFRPEFLNRVDDIVMFKPLLKEQISKIIDLEFAKILDKLKDRKIEITIDDKLRNHILEEAYSPQYGARPIKRFIQKNIETALAKGLITGEIREKDKIQMSFDGDIKFIKA